MRVYLFFVQLEPDSPLYLSSLTASDELERIKTVYILQSGIPPHRIVTQSLDIDPEAGMQSCDATQLNMAGLPQICADRREIEESRKG